MIRRAPGRDRRIAPEAAPGGTLLGFSSIDPVTAAPVLGSVSGQLVFVAETAGALNVVDLEGYTFFQEALPEVTLIDSAAGIHQCTECQLTREGVVIFEFGVFPNGQCTLFVPGGLQIFTNFDGVVLGDQVITYTD